MQITKHAAKRIRERKIPGAIIASALCCGRRVFLPLRQAVEYHLAHGPVEYVVVTNNDGLIITAYTCKRRKKVKYEA